MTDANRVSDATRRWISIAAAGGAPPLARLAPVGDRVLGPGIPAVLVALDGKASTGAPPLSFHWSQVRGAPFVVDTPGPGDGLVSIDQPGAYEFELRVFDGRAFSPPARVAFRVR